MAFGFIGFRHSDSTKTVEGMWKRRDGADYREDEDRYSAPHRHIFREHFEASASGGRQRPREVFLSAFSVDGTERNPSATMLHSPYQREGA